MPVDHACPRWRTLSRPRARRPVSRLASRKKRKARTHARLHNGGTRTCARDNTDELRRICTHGSSTAHDTRLVAYTWPYTRGRSHVAVHTFFLARVDACQRPPLPPRRRTEWMPTTTKDNQQQGAPSHGCVCCSVAPPQRALERLSPLLLYICPLAQPLSLYIWCEPCARRPTLDAPQMHLRCTPP